MKIQIHVTQPSLVEVSLIDGVLASAVTPFGSRGVPAALPQTEPAAAPVAAPTVAYGAPPAPAAPTVALDDTPAYMRDAPPTPQGWTGSPADAPSMPDAALGAERFAEFIAAWSVGFDAPLDDLGTPTVAQPNRRKLLKLTMAQHGRSIFAFIGTCGDLRAAIRSVIPEHAAPDGHDYEGYTDAIAGNVVQLASLDCPPLANTIKYTAADDRTNL